VQLGGGGRLPRVHGKSATGNRVGELLAQGAEGGDIEVKVARRVRTEVYGGQPEKTHGGTQATAVLWMRGMEVLLLQVDEGAGKLDESLEERVVGAAGLKPEVLEDIMGFVVLLGVEAGEVSLVARMQRKVGVATEAGDELIEAVTFFHRAGASGNLLCRVSWNTS